MKALRNTFVYTTVLNLGTAGASALQRTDMVVFGADNSGNWYGHPILDAAVHTSISLVVGVHTFVLHGSPRVDNPNFGVSLPFDGASTPSISAYSPMLTSPLQSHNVGANGTPNTLGLFPGLDTIPGIISPAQVR